MNNSSLKPLVGAVACVAVLTCGSLQAVDTGAVSNNAVTGNLARTAQVTGLKEREAAAKLAELLSGMNTLSARFEQQTLDDSGRRLQESRGDMLLKRPNLFRWNVTEPFPQEVVSDGHRVSYYDKDLDQLTLQDMDSRTNATPVLLLSGDTVRMLEGFTVKLSSTDNNRFFTLMPKGSDNSFEELQLTFNGLTLKEMVLTDTLGSRTRIAFSQIRVNVPIKDKSFELYVPPGVDVIDQTSAALNGKGRSGKNGDKAFK